MYEYHRCGLTWFIISHEYDKTLKHITQIDIDLLTCNGLIIKSGYYDFDDNTCIVNISM